MSEDKVDSTSASKVVIGTSGLKNKNNFNWQRALLIILPVAVVGIFLLFRSHATSVPVSVKVSGDHFVDQTGATLQLRGVNYSGTEYACVTSGDIQGYTTDPYLHGAGGVHEGAQLSYADTVGQNFLKWDKVGAAGHAINTVRIPINEGCWLGTNNVPAAYSGASYQAFIKKLVDKLTAQGMYVILDDHWSGFGTYPSNSQNVGPTDHAPTFWSQVASIYKTYPNVLFDIFNEPGVGCPGIAGCTGDWSNDEAKAWGVYVDGGSYTYKAGDNGAGGSTLAGKTVQISGVQGLITTSIRGNGANNPVIVETLGWGSGYMENMGIHMPKDPLASTSTGSQIAASFHDYHTNTNVSADWDGTLARSLSGKFPIYVGEYSITDCTFNATWINNTLSWFDLHGYSHTAWAWDANQCAGTALVTYPSGNDSGETTQVGALVKSYLQNHQGSGTPAPIDTTAPVTSLTAPTANATVSGSSVSLAASATDNVAVSEVQFKVDSTIIATDTTSPYSYTWDTRGVANGAHTVTVTASDTAGNTANSTASITINNTVPVSDTTKPSVALTAPTANATVSGSSVSLAASATDNIGVARVEFSIDGSAVVSTDTSSPYAYNWDSKTMTNGAHTLSAIAYDAAGNKASASVVVTVNNTPSPPPSVTDTVTPSAIIQAPPTNATLKGTTTISGIADGTGTAVANVRVCAGCASDAAADGATIVRNGNTATWSYPLDTTKLANGQTSVIVWVDDGAGNKGGAATAVTILNGDTQAPNVSGVNLKATATAASKVHLSWTVATDNIGVTGYYVVRGGVTIAQVGAVTSYDDGTVAASSTYNYQLIAIDAAGNHSTASTATSVTTPAATDTTPPNAPSSLNASAASTSQINLSWTASTDVGGSGLKGYNVYRNGSKITSNPITTTSYGDTGLTADTSYTYYVTSVDGAGNSSSSTATVTARTLAKVLKDIQPPTWPVGSTITVGSVGYQWWAGGCSYKTNCSQVVSWTTAKDETLMGGYNLMRSINGGAATLISSAGKTQLSVRDKPVNSGMTYTYQVVARDATGNTTKGPSVTKTITCVFNICH